MAEERKEYDSVLKDYTDLLIENNELSGLSKNITISPISSFNIDRQKLPDRVLLVGLLGINIDEVANLEFHNSKELCVLDRFVLYNINLREVTKKNVINVVLYFDRVPTVFKDRCLHFYTHKLGSVLLEDISRNMNKGQEVFYSTDFSSELKAPFVIINLKKLDDITIKALEEQSSLYSVLWLFRDMIDLSDVLNKLGTLKLPAPQHKILRSIVSKLLSNRRIKVNSLLVEDLKPRLSENGVIFINELEEEHLTLEDIAERRGEQRGALRGKQEGEIKGKQEGKQEVVLRMLSNGAGIETVCKLTGFSEEEIREML